jgi:hypothetical protein
VEEVPGMPPSRISSIWDSMASRMLANALESGDKRISKITISRAVRMSADSVIDLLPDD